MVSENIGGGKMLIGVDAGCLGVEDDRLKVGVYNVAKNLLLQLSKIDKKNTYYLYSFYPIEKDLMSELGPKMQNIVVTPTKGWMKIWLPIQIYKDKIDIFIALGQAIPWMRKSVKKIGYIYDIAFEKYPQFYPDSYKQLHAITQKVVKESDHIITLSQTSKKDICEYFGISKHRISGVLLGTKPFESTKEKVVKQKYFLYVGALKRIKNVSTVIKAFALFNKKKKEHKLILVGGDKWIDPQIEEVYEKLPANVKKQIDFYGFIDDKELFHLYQHAEALIAPSYYEGFGLPVVEAMKVGCPVIVSNRGSLPEIVGDTGLIADPNDAAAISKFMAKIVQSKSLRERMKENAMQRVKGFNWENCAKETLAIIKSV